MLTSNCPGLVAILKTFNASRGGVGEAGEGVNERMSVFPEQGFLQGLRASRRKAGECMNTGV